MKKIYIVMFAAILAFSLSVQAGSSRYCYTAIAKKVSRGFGSTRVYQSAIFVEITVNGSRSEDAIKSFGRQKASAILAGYQIVSEQLDSKNSCMKCKEDTMRKMSLDDFRVLYETMR